MAFTDVLKKVGKTMLMFSPFQIFGRLGDFANSHDGDLSGAFNSLLAKATGSELTGAEREQNQFAADEAHKQRNFEERLANTQYQRGVQDMEAAGLNPAAMFGSGQPAPTPSGSAATPGGFSPSGLGELMEMIALPAQLKKLEAETRNIDQKTRTEEQITRLQTVAADFGYRMADAQLSTLLAGIDNAIADTNVKTATVREVNNRADAQAIVNKYLDERQREEINQIKSNIGKIDAEKRASNANAWLQEIQAAYADANGFLMSSNDVLLIGTYIADLFELTKDEISEVVKNPFKNLKEEWMNNHREHKGGSR